MMLLASNQGPMLNYILFLAALFIVLFIILAIYFWKRTTLKNSLDARDGFVSNPSHEDLVGRTGKALTVLRPSGMVEIEGRRMDARTESEFIEKGARIKVIDIDGGQLVVDDDDVAEAPEGEKNS